MGFTVIGWRRSFKIVDDDGTGIVVGWSRRRCVIRIVVGSVTPTGCQVGKPPARGTPIDRRVPMGAPISRSAAIVPMIIIPNAVVVPLIAPGLIAPAPIGSIPSWPAPGWIVPIGSISDGIADVVSAADNRVSAPHMNKIIAVAEAGQSRPIAADRRPIDRRQG